MSVYRVGIAAILLAAGGCGQLPPEPEYEVREAGFFTPAGTEHVMVLVPAGPFEMGSEDGRGDERPVHRVELDAFYIDKYEVTNARYLVFAEAHGHGLPYYIDDSRYNLPDQPVVGVSWTDAVAYCRWAGMQLPTEAEWEKAARGADGRRYPWGDAAPDSTRLRFGGSGPPVPVGSYPNGASPYGAHDMAGNVWEWTLDEYDSRYYARSPRRNPVNREFEGEVEGPDRTLRGGGWSSSARDVRASVRRAIYMLEGGDVWPEEKIGFRCARNAE